jgi:hypothetical protein
LTRAGKKRLTSVEKAMTEPDLGPAKAGYKPYALFQRHFWETDKKSQDKPANKRCGATIALSKRLSANQNGRGTCFTLCAWVWLSLQRRDSRSHRSVLCPPRPVAS